ncbi:MAG: hypothetical protein O3A47_08570, partial [Chloroflexi bacterium]|nr:hypothetical protein [Chloroflexota bacterium]
MSTDCLTFEQLTQQLVLRGIALSTINEKLIVDDPAERLTPILDRAIRQHREALLCSSLAEFPKLLFAVKVASLGEDLERVVEKAEEALAASKISTTELESLVAVAAARSRQIPYSVEDMPLDQFAQSGLARRVHSRVLDEDVLFAADNAQIP